MEDLQHCAKVLGPLLIFFFKLFIYFFIDTFWSQMFMDFCFSVFVEKYKFEIPKH